MIRYVMKTVMVCAFALQAMLPGVAWSAATASVPVLDTIGTPRFASEGGAVPLPGTRTIPYFTFNQMDPTNHVTYPITYVGASPLLGTALTGIAQLSPTWESRAIFLGYIHHVHDIVRDGIPAGGAAIVRLAIVTIVVLGIAIWRIGHMRWSGAAD